MRWGNDEGKMCHFRDKIENLIKDILMDQTTVKKKIFTVSEAVYDQNYPLIMIYSPLEVISSSSKNSEVENRVLDIDVIGMIKSQANLIKDAHKISREIESALKTRFHDMPDFIQKIKLQKSEVEIQGEGEHLIGYVKLSYKVFYETKDLLADPPSKTKNDQTLQV